MTVGLLIQSTCKKLGIPAVDAMPFWRVHLDGYPVYLSHRLKYLPTCLARQFSNTEVVIGFFTNHLSSTLRGYDQADNCSSKHIT
jgi:hypothetical protein